MKNKSKNKIISLILALGCFLSGYSYIDNSLTVYASGEEVDASKIVGALNEEIEKDSQLRCCNCGEIIGENGLKLAEGEFLGKSITDLCNKCWNKTPYRILELVVKEEVDFNDFIYKDTVFKEYKNMNNLKIINDLKIDEESTWNIRAHRRQIDNYSDYIFRIAKTKRINKKMLKSGEWTENDNDNINLSEEEMKSLIDINYNNELSDIYIYCKWVKDNNEDRIGASKFEVPKRQYQKEEKRIVTISNSDNKYTIELNYKETEYLTLDGEWINFNVPQDEYDKKQRDSHFGVVNLYKENVEKIQKDYIEKIVKTISDNYRELKTESKTKKKPNLQISFTFGDNVYCITNNDIYRQDLKKRNSNKKRKEILDKNGKW